MTVAPLSEREQLASLVEQWNENRLDLFHLSYPTEDGGERVLTKCVRVSSTATTRAVVEALTDKFLPDLKMLSDDTYSLWELMKRERREDHGYLQKKYCTMQVHESGGERKLDDEEKPLLVQLTWHRDDREGRFLLRKNRQGLAPLATIQLPEEENMKRGTKRFSKREKKEMKKRHQKDIITVNTGREEALAPVTDLYCQIYGGELVPSRPYVTILVSMYDRADKILAEALEKYGIDPNNAIDYVLVEVPVSEQTSQSFNDLRNLPSDGRVIEADEAPLMQMAAKGNGYPETYLALRRKQNRGSRVVVQDRANNVSEQANMLPSAGKEPSLHFLAPDGSPMNPPRALNLSGGVTEVGSDRALAQFSAQNICLDGAEMRGRHCVITYMDGIVTITPSAADAIIEVNNRRIGQTEILRDGDLLRMGQNNLFRFVSSLKPRDIDELRHSDYSTLSHAMNAASLSGSSSVSRHQTEQVDSAPSVQTLAPMGTAQAFNGVPPSGMGPNLPLSLQIGDYKVWDYLVEVMSRGWIDAGTFRLSPAYSLYLALRFFQSHSKPYLVQFFTRIAHHMNQISQDCTSREELLFWLANASELSFLVERDPDLRTPRAGQLGTVVETVFRRLCTVLLGALRPACKPMLDTNIPIEDGSTAQKNDVAALGATCYKLNSLQVRYLLTHFSTQAGEIPCDSDVIARIVGLAERQADHLTLQDGHPITLAESEQLLLPFLLPQDGYTAEQLRGVPDGLVQYLLSLQDKGLCHSVSVQESSLATWRASPLVNSTNVTGVGDRQVGIYVKKVVAGSPAAALPGKTFPTVRYLPKGPTSPSSLPNGNAAYGKPPMYNNPPIVRPQQEPVVVRPIELAMPKDEVNLRHREEHPRSTTTFGVMAPTAFTQALQVGGAHEARVVLAPPRHSGFERELRNLERTNTALMSHDAVNEELDRLDAKGINMTEEETRRYRELLNVASEQSRRAEQRTAAVVAPTTFAVQNSNGDMSRSNANRTETLIDDVDNSPGRSAMRENISPGDPYDRKTVQFKDTVSVKETEILDSPSIYGTNEIYRDPRQQRLNELQERQETRVPDGLGFRDKMRIFATQLGEGTPKARYSASSAERQIQNEQ
ncbi:Ras association domain protein [Teladorsagia circumcincta]|uniref:Ras association domain protein n=1 Tax=Teladorsagia circumcincta TaxID=45464 RepID=A0A2G9UG49_TELCI|nr:Ras association domain protein [Teladorsagia circumcincta]